VAGQVGDVTDETTEGWLVLAVLVYEYEMKT
jgi:hypothetical protein